MVHEYQGRIEGGFKTRDGDRDVLWHLRKSLYPTVGSLRKTGTSVITEDICFDVPDLPDVVEQLHKIFTKWSYDDAIIFGHAKDGNLHFVTSIDLESDTGVRNYDGMLKDIVELTVGNYSGSLKAEHGTGRNMAPFVETEWGGDLYEMMWTIKTLADPQNILNPNVLLNRDNNAHINKLKLLPKVNDEIDLCVECGFCEPVCPSRELTLTPRQRIGLAREIKTLKNENDPRLVEVLQDYDYSGNATCAVDGLCETACPVNINTGYYIKSLRQETHSPWSETLAQWTVDHFRFVQTNLARFLGMVNGITRLVSRPGIAGISEKLHTISGNRLPAWNPWLPGPARRYHTRVFSPDTEYQQSYIYYTSCINRTFAVDGFLSNLTDLIGTIAKKCGVELKIPVGVEHTCCGTPYSSKGFSQANKVMLERTVNLLWNASCQGQFPVLVDTSPCTFQLSHAGDVLSGDMQKKWLKLTFVDIIPFLEIVIKSSDLPPLDRTVILHPTCSTQKMGQMDSMLNIARHCAQNTILPEVLDCCGFAGDRGMLVPELTRSATHHEAEIIQGLPVKATGVSSSRTCEVGMSSATGRSYESLAILVYEYLNQEKKSQIESESV